MYKMEYQLSVLLYSKYSSTCKSLMDLIQTSGIDFTNQLSLQSLCVDNEKIRYRISKNKQIHVTTVPCLLIIYPDGGIEKYDGSHVFEWVKNIINKFTPQQPLQPQQPQQPQPTQEEEILHEREQIREKNMKKYENLDSVRKPLKTRRLIKQEPTENVTSIDNLPSDEDDELISDRYRSRRPVGRIRSDEGNYIEDDELFQGEQADMRHARRSTIKGDSHNDAKSLKNLDLMSKAKELEKGREDPLPPKGHPQRINNN